MNGTTSLKWGEGLRTGLPGGGATLAHEIF